MLWGFSPATDILGQMIAIDPKSVRSGQTLNILLAGAADPRHILMTLAKYYTHDVQVILSFLYKFVISDFYQITYLHCTRDMTHIVGENAA